ncbi:MAG: metal-sensing transcriptional repressor [Candidatus Latescibacteria bacterium]|nr:metal-sensing transcriptional repressor [Candidatus Latescibacterota bacterium]
MASQTAHHSAAAMDDDLRKNLSARLKAVEGQVRGLSRMVDDGRYCVEILTQVSSIHEALRAVGRSVYRNHLETCVTDDMQSDSTDRLNRHYDELTAIAYRLAK